MARTRFQKHYTYDFHGWTGQAKSAKEAKEQAIANCEKAAEGSYSPVICCYRGMVGIVWRQPLGYCYTIARPNAGDTEPGTRYFSGLCGPDQQEAIRQMVSHIAQNGFQYGEEEAPDFMTDPGDRRDFAIWARWQNGYKAHKDAHPEATDEECRKAATIAQGYHWLGN